MVPGHREVALAGNEGDKGDTLAVADIRGRFDGPLLQASRRYETDWVATAVLYDSGQGGATTLNWRLLQDGDAVASSRDRADDSGADDSAAQSAKSLACGFRAKQLLLSEVAF